MKKAVIGSNFSNISELVNHKVNGLLIKPKSSKEIYDSLNFIMYNKNLLIQYGENGYEFAITNFQTKFAISKIHYLYNNL